MPTQLHLMSSLRINGVLTPLPEAPSRRGGFVSTGTSSTLLYKNSEHNRTPHCVQKDRLSLRHNL